MPIKRENFKSANEDPFTNLMVETQPVGIQLSVANWSDMVSIKLSKEEAQRLAHYLLKETGTEPEEALPILGYLPGGKRIHPIKPGMIATACVVSCVGCHKIIRGMGGPMRGALCLDCWEAAGL